MILQQKIDTKGIEWTVADFIFLVIFIPLAFAYYYNTNFWAGDVNIGSTQYGDASFWWNGAIQLSEGVLKDNVNLSFRMGYAIFSGLIISVFGTNYFIFHKFLLAIFLYGLVIYFYAIKPYFGRVPSYLLLILFLNPFIAERLAISTSDSVGLLFGLLSISFILISLKNNISNQYIFYGGLFLSAASLTRPLMSIFILGAIICVLSLKEYPLKQRVVSSFYLVAGYILLTLIWVLISFKLTGIMQLAGHDSSAIYAASDPHIQVWSNEMYAKVEESAKRHFNSGSVDAAQMSKEFWTLTFQNYITYADYHFKRFIYNVIQIIKFLPINYPGIESIKVLKIGFFTSIAIFILLFTSANKIITLVLTLVFLYILKSNNFMPIEALTLIGAISFPCLMIFSKRANAGFSIITMFWWSGIVALYLVGGVWGPPIGQTYDLNALGYRLGSQFFFSTDAIFIAVIVTIYSIVYKSESLKNSNLRNFKFNLSNVNFNNFLVKPCNKLAFRLNRIIILFIVCIFGIGFMNVGINIYKRSYTSYIQYPNLTSTYNFLTEKLNLSPSNLKIAKNYGDIITETGSADIGIKNSPYVLFSGGLSDFIWNLPGQERSKAILYVQKYTTPFELSTGELYVEFPKHMQESEWKRKQGVWLVRSIEDRKVNSNLPYFYSVTAVKAFVPLNAAGDSYSLKDAIFFNSVKSASQLVTSEQLRVIDGKLKWYGDSGQYKYPRRFSVTPDSSQLGYINLILDLKQVVAPRSLSFCAQLAVQDSINQAKTIIQVIGVTADKKNYLIYDGKLSAACNLENQLNVALEDKNFNYIEIKITSPLNLPIWFYEFNLTAENFQIK